MNLPEANKRVFAQLLLALVASSFFLTSASEREGDRPSESGGKEEDRFELGEPPNCNGAATVSAGTSFLITDSETT